ncbi:MAG: hypothetical protein JST22_21145 [Bacteroidetes bacterium]|nr:hypothetical protein [Bacteroidota bacterium]
MKKTLRLRPAYAWVIGTLLLCLTATVCHAQTDTISGVINRYTLVTFFECTNNAAFNVQNPAGFKAGDKILILQLQGADVELVDTSSFGSVTDLHNAGNYELATIDNVNGYTIELTCELARTYTLSDGVQIVRVPQYNNVVIADTIRAKPWDGYTGGVVALIASGTITMNADITATGAGFRDGLVYGPLNFPSAAAYTDYRNLVATAWRPLLYSCRAGSDSGGLKGEGIHKAAPSYNAAKGALANAGGGGNEFFGNTEFIVDDMTSVGGGGGGGGNCGHGGNGKNTVPSNGDNYPGIGGYALHYGNDSNRIFLGGSGGWGGIDPFRKHAPGMAGGGIVYVQANQIYGGGHKILAEGGPQLYADVTDHRPGGGGGAGGVILLDVGSFASSVTASVDGGHGQDAEGCQGTGGGGGGGCVWLTGSNASPSNLTRHAWGGASGTSLGTSCGTLTAGPGADGAILTNLQVPHGTIAK